MSAKRISHNRHLRILNLLKEHGVVDVEHLSADLKVSKVTVRRDLDTLDRAGLLSRTHGGAAEFRSRRDAIPERQFDEKGVLNMDEKRRIGERAAELVGSGEIVFMNSGTTVLFFLSALRGTNVRIVTNNAAALQWERDPRVELMILGGEYRDQSRSLVGEIPLNLIKEINSDHTILGTNGLDLKKGLTTSVYQECSINKGMIDSTRGKVIVLADSTKMGQVSNFCSSPIDLVNVVITDDRCPGPIRAGLEKLGIEVIIA